MQELETLKPYLKDYVESITEKSRNGAYICPICGSGTGKNRSGAFSITPDGQAWKCFSCNNGGDLFNLIGLKENIPEFKDQLDRAKQLFNVSTYTSIERPQRTRRARVQEEVKADFTSYFVQCKNRINEILPYLKNRGFTDEIIDRFNLGYDPQCYNKPLKMIKPSLIIPYGKNYYISRPIDIKQYDKPQTKIAGSEPIFNVEAFKSDKPIFICEAPLDALSIIQAGGEAVALGGTGSTKLINYLKENPVENTLILNFDNDDAGKNETEKIKKDLNDLKINYTVAKYSYKQYKQNKDANDLLISDKSLFISEVIKNIGLADPNEKHKNSNAYELLKNFYREVDPKKTLYIPTGFMKLDKILDGGLYPGLYIIGAISSLGKTTLALQIAENIAKSGQDVLIYSLEMGANELLSKSISRMTFLVNPTYAKTSREIARGEYTPTEAEIINQAKNIFNSYSNNIYIFEGIGDIGVEQIKKDIERHIKLTGKTPVIFIDYLQILAPYDMRASDKQNTDKSVVELKRLSRDYNTPVFGISSFNRENYNTAVSMNSYKESGAIEYGSDVLLGLQPAGMKQGRTAQETKENEKIVEACKSSTKRDLELKILKNRNGATNGVINLKYYTMYNVLQEGFFNAEQINKIKDAVDSMKNIQRTDPYKD